MRTAPPRDQAEIRTAMQTPGHQYSCIGCKFLSEPEPQDRKRYCGKGHGMRTVQLIPPITLAYSSTCKETQ